jgi:hypothetical protein
MNDCKIGFAKAVREHGDFWLTGLYFALPRETRLDSGLGTAILLSSYEFNGDIHDSEEMRRLMRFRADRRLPQAA